MVAVLLSFVSFSTKLSSQTSETLRSLQPKLSAKMDRGHYGEEKIQKCNASNVLHHFFALKALRERKRAHLKFGDFSWPPAELSMTNFGNYVGGCWCCCWEKCQVTSSCIFLDHLCANNRCTFYWMPLSGSLGKWQKATMHFWRQDTLWKRQQGAKK